MTTITDRHYSNDPETSGRARRCVNRTKIVRPIRLDIRSDNALSFVRARLAEPGNFRDLCSVSMAVRRALRLYCQHVERLDPSGLFNEREEVRQMSQLPRPGSRSRRHKVALN